MALGVVPVSGEAAESMNNPEPVRTN